MCETCTTQRGPAASGFFLLKNNPRLSREPALTDLLRDPMTIALMTADRVDRRQFDALLTQVRAKLR
jgi:hypothetical protein